MSDEIRKDGETTSGSSAKPHSQQLDKFAVRRAEIKRQKRKAHQRKLNASNRPG